MSRNPLRSSLSLLVSLALVAGPMPSVANDTIRCESRNFQYRYCRVDTDNRVRLQRQLSSADCREDRSWGYDRHGVWVDRGCGAEFRVGRDSHGSDRAVVGAVVGLAALAAIAASQQKSTHQDAETWALGTFSGFDEFEGVQVTLEIMPGGTVAGRAGAKQFSGQVNGSRLQAGQHQFTLSRSGTGFIATDDRNPGHRVVFQRMTEGGY